MRQLGIEPGDVVWTSYNTGPYRVKKVTGPYRERYDAPAARDVPTDFDVYSLTLEDLGRHYGPPINRFHRNSGDSYINEVT
ncbi:MAG TPA: hypothetical protein VF212_07120, partial [Longimicrobiales bacterium]